MATRNPAVAGQFYPGTPDALRKMIRDMVDEGQVKKEAVGVLVPHAGYIYSGMVAGDVFSRVRIPETAVIIGPNHTGAGVMFSVMAEGTWKTPLGEVEIDSELAQAIMKNTGLLQKDTLAHQFEHAVEVQVPFLQYLRPDIKIVPVIFGPTEGEKYREVGRAIAEAIAETGRQTLIIASSDMTHYESGESARKKDSKAIEAVLDMDETALLERVREYDISMCGYAPAVSLLVAAKELGADSAELVRYQNSGDVNGDYGSVVGYAGIIISRSNPIVRLARETVEAYVKNGSVIEPKAPTDEMKQRAGVFVTLHKHGDLRGCIGTFEPTTPDIAHEIVTNGISAATRDPRFPPVDPSELKDIGYSVDVLTKPVPVDGPEDLDPKKYGVIVQAGYRRGLLLPDLEGVDTVAQQIAICRQKAGIYPDEPVNLYRFEVKRYEE